MSGYLPQAFFRQPVRDVAPAMLGATLAIRDAAGEVHRHTITEVEAYDGPNDKACHASRGRTQRTEVMFWQGGVFYVYLVYGMHYMLNIVTGERDYPAAVLIRSLESVNGPGRLTKQLGITTTLNGKSVSRITGLWFEGGEQISPAAIKKTPRVGVEYAQEWADAPLRYVRGN